MFGPRGTGKTTWLKDNLTNAYVVDLLKNDIRLRLMAHPERLRDMVAANDDRNQIVIDEIQKVPALLDVVHSLMEEFPSKRFVLTRLSTFASTANFFRGVTPRDGVVCRESSRIASRNAV